MYLYILPEKIDGSLYTWYKTDFYLSQAVGVTFVINCNGELCSSTRLRGFNVGSSQTEENLEDMCAIN